MKDKNKPESVWETLKDVYGEDSTITVVETLPEPVLEKEELNILCLKNYQSYVYGDSKNKHLKGDIVSLVEWLSKHILSLNHDGHMKITVERYRYTEEKEVPIKEVLEF